MKENEINIFFICLRYIQREQEQAKSDGAKNAFKKCLAILAEFAKICEEERKAKEKRRKDKNRAKKQPKQKTKIYIEFN